MLSHMMNLQLGVRSEEFHHHLLAQLPDGVSAADAP